jgi:hypothetical protein
VAVGRERMNWTRVRSASKSLGVALLFIALTVVMTWPQARSMGTRVFDADDPLLSIWRVSWIAHVLPQDPLDLFNGNIFYPEKRTLAYTDSVLLQGAAGAPLIWSGVSRVTTYNVLLLLSMALSGWAMWRYALHLTGDPWAAIVGGIIFAFVPYRFDHYHHLELQATIFLPLTLLFFDRTTETGSRRDAWLTMAAFVAQVYSCIYYSVFLATALIPIAAIRIWPLTPERRIAFLKALWLPVTIAVVAVLPYAIAYGLNRGNLGERLDRDVLLYSAELRNYLATPEWNVVHGWWSRQYGQPERLLFPGVLAIAVALVGLLKMDRQRVTLIVLGLTGFVISMGLRTPLYEPLRAIIFPYRGLRAPARASILLFLALAALATFGWARVLRNRPAAIRVAATIVMCLALLAEYRTRMESWYTFPDRPAQVYRWLAAQPRSVVAEVPFARADALHSIPDGVYMFNSTWHWQPIVNGYSGFFPKTFIDLAEHTASFPDERSIAYLKQRGVDLLVIHGNLMDPEDFGDMTSTLLARPDIEALAKFDERMGSDVVFRLRR